MYSCFAGAFGKVIYHYMLHLNDIKQENTEPHK